MATPLIAAKQIGSRFAPQGYGEQNQFQYQDPQRSQFNAQNRLDRSTAEESTASRYNTQQQEGGYNESTQMNGFNKDTYATNPMSQGLKGQFNTLSQGYSKYDPKFTGQQFKEGLGNKNLSFISGLSGSGKNLNLTDEDIAKYQTQFTDQDTYAKDANDANKITYDGVKSSFDTGVGKFGQDYTNALNYNPAMQSEASDYGNYDSDIATFNNIYGGAGGASNIRFTSKYGRESYNPRSKGDRQRAGDARDRVIAERDANNARIAQAQASNTAARADKAARPINELAKNKVYDTTSGSWVDPTAVTYKKPLGM